MRLNGVMSKGDTCISSGGSSLGLGDSPLHSLPIFKYINNYPIKCNNGPNYFVFMGNLKIMTCACMPPHARACMFLKLSLYVLMHVSIKAVLICLYMYMYV